MKILQRWRERWRRRKIVKEFRRSYLGKIRYSERKLEKIGKDINSFKKIYEILKKEMEILDALECNCYKGMKANELSVGDWVQVRYLTIGSVERLTPPMRVSAIGEDWVNTMIVPEQGDPFEDDFKDIRPIPLTAGILEKNGFERTSESPYVLEYRVCVDDKCEAYIFVNFRLRTGMIQVCFDSAGTFPKIGFTKYEMSVHDLQHALRMCGIDKDIIL